MKHPYIPPEEMDDHIKQEIYLASKMAGKLWVATLDFMKTHEERGACISVPLIAFQMLQTAFMGMMDIQPEDVQAVNVADLGVDFGEIGRTLQIEEAEENKDGNQL